MGSDTTLFAASLFAGAASLALIWRWRQSERPPYPPGPKGYPLIGNILDLPKDVPIWKTFMSLAKQYDTDVLYLTVMTTDHVVLGSAKAISDVTDKRANVYSDRPTFPMLELMDGFSWNIPSMKYGKQWRNCRRLLHEFLNITAVTRFDEYQLKHANRFLLCLAETPGDFLDHVKFLTGALIMDITYGIDIKSHEDQFLQAAERAMQQADRAIVPGEFLVDTIPILKYVPEWFPGAGFKTFARETGAQFSLAVDGPLTYMKQSPKLDGKNASVASICFDRVAELADRGFDERIVRQVTSTMYIAASDTTTSVMKSFFLAMALYPEVIRKAQEELDRTIGSERLPELSDWDKLPYISALMKELLRWTCPIPFGIPKRAMEDGIYKGYFIPAGATVIENIWAVCYDETVYPSPSTYDPERFLKDGKLDLSVGDPEIRVFGSGKRICPGKHFALRTLFLNISRTLATFDIEPPAGQMLEAEFHESAIRHPNPFECVIKPRSEARLELIRNACATTDS